MRHLERDCDISERNKQAPTNDCKFNYLDNLIELFVDGLMWSKEQIELGHHKVHWVKKKAPKKFKNMIPLDKIGTLSLSKAKTLLKSIEEKKLWFEHKCNVLRVSFLEDSITLVIDREQMLRDSLL